MDDAARIQVLHRDRWIDYHRANQALAQLDRLLATPQKERMPCMMYGDSNIGKTQVVAKFRRTHPATFDDTTGVEHHPVVAMQMPATPDQHRFYTGPAPIRTACRACRPPAIRSNASERRIRPDCSVPAPAQRQGFASPGFARP
jgi:hypothetical protein